MEVMTGLVRLELVTNGRHAIMKVHVKYNCGKFLSD
jgi:hypothetical protein